jgi:hypothetical protein
VGRRHRYAGYRYGGHARGYSWQQFTPTHGASSPTALQPIADQLGDDLAVVAPWTQAAAFSGAVRSYLWAEAQLLLLREYVDRLGIIDEHGEIPAGVGSLLYRIDTTEGRLAKLRTELGLTPQSLASLLTKASSVARAVNDADMLAALEAEGLAITRARALMSDDNSSADDNSITALQAPLIASDSAGVQRDPDAVNDAQRSAQRVPAHESSKRTDAPHT